jgi:hypothetical protein
VDDIPVFHCDAFQESSSKTRRSFATAFRKVAHNAGEAPHCLGAIYQKRGDA